jgi:hypothetical protein
MNRWWNCGLLALRILSDCRAAEAPISPCPQIESAAITEASGLAVSPKNAALLWVINDSGGSTDLHLMGLKGEDRGSIKVEGVANRDWEDLSSFTLDGIAYLLIADTGDNYAKHDSSTLLIVREPVLPDAGKKLEGVVTPERAIHFKFEGGAVDCESVAVDAISGKIILLSKRTQPPQVYVLPLGISAAGIQIARRIGQTTVESPAGPALPFGNQPTGLDLSPDGSMAAVVTYYGVFLFPRMKAETWAEALAKKPISLGPHGLPQAESIAFSKDGKTLCIVSEGLRSMICYLSLKMDK